MRQLIIAITIISLLYSCRTQQDVLYLQNINEVDISNEYYQSPEIQTGDVLTIVVSAFDDGLAKPYNLGGRSNGGGYESDPLSYLVDGEGNIEIPMLGTIHAEGKNRKELATEIRNSVSQFIEDPMVNIRILNFKVTMLGEFNKQGIVKSPSEKLNILEAIAKSGGMSFYAIRDSVLLIRTENGKRKHSYVNLHDANLMNNENFYLKQNDILYAMPTKSRATEFNTRPITATLSVIGFVTAIITLFR